MRTATRSHSLKKTKNCLLMPDSSGKSGGTRTRVRHLTSGSASKAGGARGELAEHQNIADDLRRLLDAGFVFDVVERQPTRYDLEHITGKPLHWDIEFPELLPLEEANGMHPEIEFDIVIGNPPYGDILNQNEEMFTAPYLTGSVNDVSAPFVERQLQLTADQGYFGNVTTLRLIYQSSLEEFHDLLRSTLDPARVACFGMWGRVGVFENALVRVALLSGQKNTDTTGPSTRATSPCSTEITDSTASRILNIARSMA